MAQRSTFVTVVALVFIILAGMATLMTLAQNVLILFLLPMEEMQYDGSEAAQTPELPPFFSFFMRHPHLWFQACFLVSLVALISAVGLFRRRNWGRLLFVGVLAFGIVWCLGSLVLVYWVFFDPAYGGMENDHSIQAAFMVIGALTAVFALAVSSVFAWLIRRLVSGEVREEFRVHSQARVAA